MKKEQAYAFKEKLLTVHDKDVYIPGKKPGADMTVLTNGAIIEIGNTASEVIAVAAADFVDFLSVSMGISASVSTAGTAKGENVISLVEDSTADLGEAAGYKGFLIRATDGIEVFGYDERGVASALYYLEDMMCLEKAPFVKQGEIRKRPAMTPHMVHSGYGMEQWPDNYLMRIAHEGRDAILVFTKDVNETRVGFLDFNDLIRRAARYGIDVYAYAFMAGDPHPKSPEAEAYYDNCYGKLFRECPGLKGVTMVGEAVEYRSDDPHVTSFLAEEYFQGMPGTQDIPDGKFWPGWYPCEDLPQWLEMIERIVHKAKPDADIVLWSYNWGFQPEDVRVRLIENMPKNITLEATFEMFDSKPVGDVKVGCSDYSLSFEGPGPYFVSEAIAAKKRGIKLYAMTQSAGVTWDFGTAPYEPMPYQWMKRFENIRKAITDWDLCGSMDTHHHGMYPSIITKLSKHAFLLPFEPLDEILEKICISEYGEENLDAVKEGFRLWSEAIPYYTPTEGDFDGASRIGPAYPFTLFFKTKPENNPGAIFGTAIYSLDYCNGMEHANFVAAAPREHAINLRIHPELESLKTMHKLMEAGVAAMEKAPNPNEKLLSVLNLGKYITHCVKTNIHAKEWYILKCKLFATFEAEGMLKIMDQMDELLEREAQNARETLPIVEADSRLGWEPTMEYLGDAPHIQWKLRQLDYVRNLEMVKFRKSVLLK